MTKTSTTNRTTYARNGNPTRTSISDANVPTTRLAESTAGAIVIRKALAATLPYPQIVSSNLIDRKLDLAQNQLAITNPTAVILWRHVVPCLARLLSDKQNHILQTQSNNSQNKCDACKQI